MSLIQNLLNRVIWWKNPREENSNEEGYEWFIKEREYGFIQIQQILIWDDLTRSILCIGAVNIFFWLLVLLEWRFYGLVFLTLFVGAVLDMLNHYGQLGVCRALNLSNLLPAPKSPPQFRVLSAEELCTVIRHIQSKASALYGKIRQLRQDQPAIFCVTTCACCLMLSLMGRIMSMSTFLYTMLMSSLTLPALCVRYPECCRLIFSYLTPEEEEEAYLPEPTDNALHILSLAEEHVDPVTADASLYPDLTSMPSHDNSIDFLNSDAQFPSPRQVDQDLSDSDISEPQELEFKSKSFAEDGSSTSSGEELAKGLRFRGNVRRAGSSDSSDSFELISKDDL